MVSIAYDATNDASHRTRMRTDSWLLPDVTKFRQFMSYRAIVYDAQRRRGMSHQRNMPEYTDMRKWASAFHDKPADKTSAYSTSIRARLKKAL